MNGWAARYSHEIDSDLARGYSFAGWAILPEPDEPAMREALTEQWGWSPRAAREQRIEEAPGGGWLPAHNGLCAYYDDDREVAVEKAQAAGRFAGVPLWVFPAEYLESDPSDGSDIVRATGPAVSVAD